MEFSNKTGNYKIDDIDIYVFPDKIIVDTGNRSRRQRDDDYERSGSGSGKKNKGSDGNSDGNGKKKEKGDWLNDLLDNAQDIVTGKKQV
jgi:hypothetical protein